jgi:hypothetical protein
MHFELPKLPLHGFKDFAKHYLMIVLSILTALGLEAWIEHTHHRHAAEIAVAQIEAEIHANRAAIDRVHAHDVERMHALEKLRDAVLHDMQAHVPDATILQHVHEQTPDGLYLDWRWPTLKHEAWDVAVADQSASWIDNERLRRYSDIYAAQTRDEASMTGDVPLVLDGPRMVDAMINLQVDNVRPEELLHVINQMAWLTSEASHNLESLGREIDAGLSLTNHDAAKKSAVG